MRKLRGVLYITHKSIALGGGLLRQAGALGINDAGKVVGYSYLSGARAPHAFLWDGKMHDLGTLGEFSSVAQGINNSDEIVGYSIVSETDEDHAFLYSDGVMRDLNSLIPKKSGWVLNRAYAINDNGNIVGYGINKRGLERAFLLVPTQ